MTKLTIKLVALLFLALPLALMSCGGGGGNENQTPTNPNEGFSPISPFQPPNGGDPHEQTPYRTGNFTLPNGQFGDLRGVGSSARYVYVADRTTVYAFDMQGNFVNSTAAPSTVQGLAVIPPDPFPGQGFNYP